MQLMFGFFYAYPVSVNYLDCPDLLESDFFKTLGVTNTCLHFQISTVSSDENNRHFVYPKKTLPNINSTHAEDSEDDLFFRISDGNWAKERQFPWHVRIKSVKHHEAVYCGGSIISDLWILTAAHCTFGFKYLIITYGSIYFNRLPYKTASKHWINHKGYRERETHHDISIVRVRKPMIFTKNIQPISIVRGLDTLEDFDGQKAIVIGFGASKNRKTWSPVLLYTFVRVLSQKRCGVYFVRGMVGADNVCAEGYYSRTAGACPGDSGGSLVIEQSDRSYVLIGVAAFESQFGCGHGVPSGYTLVGPYANWIRKTTGIL